MLKVFIHKSVILSAILCSTVFVGTLSAQDIDRAIEAYNDDRHAEAAFLFYDVMNNSSNAEAKMRAEYYLAHSLYKGGYVLASYEFYRQVFDAGESHPFFLKAASGLLNIAREISDDTAIPEAFNKGYSRSFANLRREELNSINYMIGMILERRGDQAQAKQFLEAVTDESPYYVKARYLMGIMAAKTLTKKGTGDYSEAVRYFSEIETALEGKRTADEKKLYRLALLGKARAYYSAGDFKKSIEYYEKVPRFSDDWYDAMFESGWAYFQEAKFGRALGMVHSIQSPYFDDRYRAESWVLKSTVYFQNCHFDRSAKALEDFFKIYEPMSEQMKPWLLEEKTNDMLVEAVQKGDSNFPKEIQLRIAANRRFQKFEKQLGMAEAELAKAEKEFPEGGFKGVLISILRDMRTERVNFLGSLVRVQLSRESQFLDNFLEQARIIKFETADAERKMLELGKDITKGPRARGPRPYLPSEVYQYWAFQGEYWIDELGYYEHSIKNECLPEIFARE